MHEVHARLKYSFLCTEKFYVWIQIFLKSKFIKFLLNVFES